MKWIYIFLLLVPGYGSMARQSIDTTEVVELGGIKQFIRIKGNERSKPLFLFLHGGPGGSVMNYADKFTYQLQKEFVVVQWDQRETGKTLELNSSPAPLTLQLFENDTFQLMKLLLSQFGKTKLYLAGHSWGTILAFSMADQHPELLYACIAISPVIDQNESERILLKRMREQLSGNPQAMAELAQVRIPFENGEQLYIDRKWLPVFNGKSISEVNKTFTKSFALSWSARWLKAWKEASAINRMKSLTSFRCPVYLLTGRRDYQTNFDITESYYKKITAPLKDLFWFEHSRHAVPTTEPDLMQKIIISKILPQTLR